jgi:hypothetical protein
MRGRTQNNRNLGRRRRRCLLAGLLAVTAQVAQADSPIAIAPLPLVVPTAPIAGQLQANPFCQPVPGVLGDLAEPEFDLVAAPQLRRASDVRGPGVAVVDRAYQQPGNRYGIDEQPLSRAGGLQQSSGRRGNAPAQPAEDGGMRSLIQESAPLASGEVRSNPLVATTPTPVSDVRGVKSLVVTADPAPSGPISFSFSDDHSAPIDTTPTPPTSGSPAIVKGSEPPQFSEVRQRPQSRPRTPWNGSNPPSVAHAHTPQPTHAPQPTLARPASTGRTLVVPREGDSGAAAVQTVGRVQLPQPKSLAPDNARLVNGSRPKVEVGRPPLAIEREGKRTLVVAEASPPAKTSTPANSGLPTPEPTKAVQLRFKPTEVRSLKVENEIQKVEVQSAAVCAVVKTGPNQLQLIATGDGVTKLTLWTVDPAGKTHSELYEVHVAAAEKARVDDPHSMAATLTQSVNSAFPQSRVLVRYSGGRFEATGSCTDEDSARRILRMVRSACQMPVDDKVVVR